MMSHRNGDGHQCRGTTLEVGIFLLVAAVFSTLVPCTSIRAAEVSEIESKPADGGVAVPSDPATLQPSCSGDAANLLYPLEDSTLALWTLAMPPCDDCSSASIPLGFTFDLYGDAYGDVFVNNNGSISFVEALGTFWPDGFPDDRYVNVAPFYADADTRDNPDPSVPSAVYWKSVDGNGDGVAETFVATWRNIGHHERSFDRRNTFQVAISDGSNLAMGLGNNVCFSYDTMCWTTGNFDGGIGGFGSVPAVVGANRGDGVQSFYIGRFNHDGSDSNGPGGAPGGVHFLDRRRFCFSTATTTGNLCPIALDDSGDPIRIEPGQAFTRSLGFVSPESNQVTSLTVDDPANAQGAGLSIATAAGNPATASLSWNPTCGSLGTYPLVFHATDDAATPCTADTPIDLLVTCDDGDPCTADACVAGSGCTHDRKDCDDDNPCTDDSCDAQGGCINTPNNAPCDDGEACSTDDRCQDGQCVGSGSGSCDDGNPCTDDRCSPTGGCTHTANHDACDDGNVCTTGDRCHNRRCVAGRRKSCDDGDVCTRDSCHPAEGCRHVESDDDEDGICNRRDVCEDTILTPTVVIGTCDSQVPNTLFPFGCSISDFLDLCEERRGCARANRARCVDQTLDLLRRFGVITRDQRRAIEHCYRP